MTPYIDVDAYDSPHYQTEYFVTPPAVPTFPDRRPVRQPRGLGKHPVAVMAVLLLVVVPLLMLTGTLILHNLRTEPRQAILLVGSEIREGILRSSEPVRQAVPVYQRTAGDYFRSIRGELVLADGRLVYVGLLPRDVFAAGSDPDIFERAIYPVDTLIVVRRARAILGTSQAVVIERDGDRMTLAVPDESWPAAEQLVAAVEARHRGERAEAARIEAERRAADEAARRPIYHTVARGEALSTIATRYAITVERVQELNEMTDTKIRVGQTLLVKPDER